MAWLAAIVVLPLLVFSAGFRIAAGVLVAIVVIFVLYQRESESESEREERARIPPNQLEFSNMILEREYWGRILKGRIKNLSPQYTLTGLALTITIEDCEGDGPHPSCVTIGEDKDHDFLVDIPPGQARDISELIFPSSMQPKGKLQWFYSISYTMGK